MSILSQVQNYPAVQNVPLTTLTVTATLTVTTEARAALCPLPHICPSIPISGSVPPASLALAFSHLALHQPPSSPPASTPCLPLCLCGNQYELAACKSGDVTALPNSAKASHFSLNKRKMGNSVCMVCRHFSTPFPTSLHAMQGFVCKPPTTSRSEGSSNILPCFRAAVLAGPLISSHISKGIQSFHPLGFSLNLTYSERPFWPTPARQPCSLSQLGSLQCLPPAVCTLYSGFSPLSLQLAHCCPVTHRAVPGAQHSASQSRTLSELVE